MCLLFFLAENGADVLLFLVSLVDVHKNEEKEIIYK